MPYLRNNGVYSKEEYVGKSIDEAKKYATDGGFTIRIVEEDGKTFMLTADVKSDRLNFRVRGGYVTDVYGG